MQLTFFQGFLNFIESNYQFIIQISIQYFRLGYQVPADYNPADFYIQTLAILPSSREESLAKATVI